jgi:hypothetical protein
MLRRRIPRLPFLILALMATFGASAAQAGKQGRAPRFSGLKSAEVCIQGPGPHPGETRSFGLQWEAARAHGTSTSKIVYEIYQATRSGGENYSAPAYTTAPGATSFNTPMLPVFETTYYFVVRARDRHGNEDTNTVEREGQNVCE